MVRQAKSVRRGRDSLGPTIFPIEAGDKVAAGITDQGYLQFTDQVQNILTEAVLICLRMSGLVDTGVDGAAKMLNKRTVKAVVGMSDSEIAVKRSFGVFVIHM